VSRRTVNDTAIPLYGEPGEMPGDNKTWSKRSCQSGGWHRGHRLPFPAASTEMSECGQCPARRISGTLGAMMDLTGHW